MYSIIRKLPRNAYVMCNIDLIVNRNYCLNSIEKDIDENLIAYRINFNECIPVVWMAFYLKHDKLYIETIDYRNGIVTTAKYWSLGTDKVKLMDLMKYLEKVYLNEYCKEEPLECVHKYNIIKYHLIEHIKNIEKSSILKLSTIDGFALNFRTNTHSIDDFNVDTDIKIYSKYQEVTDIAPTMYISNIKKYADINYQEMSNITINEKDLIEHHNVIILAFDECKRCNDNIICVYNIFRYNEGILIKSIQDVTILSIAQYTELLEIWKENCTNTLSYERVDELIARYFK